MAVACAGAAQGAKRTVLKPGYAWRLEAPLGLRTPAELDTLPANYAQRSVPSDVSDAWAATGNLGGAGYQEIWSERRPLSDFFFRDAFSAWLPSFDKMRFYNTRIPMTLLSYNTGGTRENAQDRLQATFSGNANARTQVGAMVDYLYSKGSYPSQAAKNFTWGFSGSYIGDRYDAQAFFYHYNLVSKENGGITDTRYITDPAAVQGGVTTVNPSTIPTRLSNAHTRVRGQQAYLNQRFKIGFWDEQRDSVNTDSVVSRTYVPVTSLIWTIDFNSGMHLFRDDASGEIADFFEHTYLNTSMTEDRASYWSLSNTAGIALLEGFHRYAKFGLAAFATYDIIKYIQPSALVTPGPGLSPMPATAAPEVTDNNIYVGGQLTKQQGSVVTYDATGRLGIAGRAMGDVNLSGRLTTRLPLLGDTVSVEGRGQFTNTAAPYFLQHYVSNHFVWDNDFGKQRVATVGGSVALGRTDTRVDAEVSNVQNHIYFNSAFMPVQHAANVQVVSARIRQGLKAGIFHWDNRLTLQTSTDDAVIPLPRVALYSNLYLKFRVATLWAQVGVDCDYYTAYHAPAYQPATAAFANQSEVKLGNYPFMNLYANCKLDKARFYVMYSHFNQGWLGGRDYFAVVGYPLNPSMLQLGVSVDFAN